MSTYQQDALRTEAKDFPSQGGRVIWPQTLRLMHAGIGLATESGELLDALKKHVFYGKPIDETNFIEELGDLMWYIAIACDALGTTIEEVQAINIAKLKARYPAKFTEDAAINRDLDAERKVLEQ